MRRQRAVEIGLCYGREASFRASHRYPTSLYPIRYRPLLASVKLIIPRYSFCALISDCFAGIMSKIYQYVCFKSRGYRGYQQNSRALFTDPPVPKFLTDALRFTVPPRVGSRLEFFITNALGNRDRYKIKVWRHHSVGMNKFFQNLC